MRYARATFRLFALCCITAGYYLRWLTGAPFVFASNSRARNWRNRNFRGWARTSARVMGVIVNVRNEAPSPPFLLVSNHLSYVDIIVLGSQADCAFVAKSEVASWPIIGLVCRTMDTIFIDRKLRKDIPSVMQQIDNTLGRGLGVVLFAEGTSTNGQSVLPFKTSLLDFAARNYLPVHYASIGYFVPSGETSADRSVCWWGDMTFSGHLFRLLQLPSFKASLFYGSEPIVADDRRVLAAKLWSAVSSQLRPAVDQSGVIMESNARIINNCIGLLEQAIGLIEQIDDDVYVSTSPLSPRGSIGGHLRHILDFYQGFLAGIESGRINYNLRHRDALIERERRYAIITISRTITALRTLPGLEGKRPLLVSTEENGESPPVWCASSVLRELDFLQSHTVHHYSLVAMLLRLHEIDPGEDFGAAASTLNYWKEEAACAQ